MAFGEVISYAYYAIEPPIAVNLTGSTAFAVWGSGGNSTTEASLAGGPETLISGYLDLSGSGVLESVSDQSLPQFNYIVSGTQVFGGLQYGELSSGAAARLHFNPSNEPDSETRYAVWLMIPAGSAADVSIIDYASGTSYPVASLGSSSYGVVTLTTSGALDHTVLQVQSTGTAGSAFLVGAATASVVPVPEPEYWLAGLILLSGAALYLTVVYGSAWYISEGDGDKRDEP